MRAVIITAALQVMLARKTYPDLQAVLRRSVASKTKWTLFRNGSVIFSLPAQPLPQPCCYSLPPRKGRRAALGYQTTQAAIEAGICPEHSTALCTSSDLQWLGSAPGCPYSLDGTSQ